MKLTNTALRWAAAIGCAAFVLAFTPASFARVPHAKIHRVLSGEDRKEKEGTEKDKKNDHKKNDDKKDDTKDDSSDNQDS